MGKMYDYPAKIGSDILPDLDYVIVTNGAEEYIVSITEFIGLHLTRTSHDHSNFKIESEIRAIADTQAEIKASAAIAIHQTPAETAGVETGWDHSLFVDSLEAGNIADNHIATYFPLLTTNPQDGQTLIYNSEMTRWENGSVFGWSGTFTSVDNKLITVTNGIIVSAVESSIWFDYTIDEANSGEDGTEYYNENGVAGWTFTEQV